MSLQAFLEARRARNFHPGAHVTTKATHTAPRTIIKSCAACGKKVPMVMATKSFRLDASRPDGLSARCISCENLDAAKELLQERKRTLKGAPSSSSGGTGGERHPKELNVRCRKCGFVCGESEAVRYFGDKRSICKVCVSEITLEVDRKLAASLTLQRRIVKLNGCMIVPGYEGQRCEKSYNCEYYESCLDVAADRAWLGWRTVRAH